MASPSSYEGLMLNVNCSYCGEQIPVNKVVFENKKSLWFCETCIRELYQKGLEAKDINEINHIKKEYGI